MPAKKKTQKKTRKITVAPSGASFTFTPRPSAKRTKCPGCGKGHVVDVHSDMKLFKCSKRCGWKSPSGNFKHKPTKPQTPWKRKPIKKASKR